MPETTSQEKAQNKKKYLNEKKRPNKEDSKNTVKREKS